MDVTKPYEFIEFGAMDVTKPYKSIGCGAMDVTKPCKFRGFGASARVNPRPVYTRDPGSRVGLGPGCSRPLH